MGFLNRHMLAVFQSRACEFVMSDDRVSLWPLRHFAVIEDLLVVSCEHKIEGYFCFTFRLSVLLVEVATNKHLCVSIS